MDGALVFSILPFLTDDEQCYHGRRNRQVGLIIRSFQFTKWFSPSEEDAEVVRFNIDGLDEDSVPLKAPRTFDEVDQMS